MKLKSITIVRLLHNSDKIYMETDLPEATYPYKDSLQLEFSAAKGSAESYCAKHFPDVPIKAIV